MTLAELLHQAGPCYGDSCTVDDHEVQAAALVRSGVHIIGDGFVAVNQPFLQSAASETGLDYWNTVDDETRVFDFARWSSDVLDCIPR